jgi:hypothetical protein
MNRLILAGALAVGLLAAGPVAHADHDYKADGWTLLGEETVEGRRDTDVIKVGRREGRFTALMLVVLDDDLQLTAMTVELGNGKTFSPKLSHYFAENTRSKEIDLPGEARGINTITLTYGEFGRLRDHRKKGKGARRHDFTKARVQVWGKLFDEDEIGWSAQGWTSLGRKVLRKAKGSVTFKVGHKTSYDRLSVVASDGDVRITEVVVTFNRGKKAVLKVDQRFTRGSRQRSIDIAPAGRTIKSLEVKYLDRDGGDRSTIEVFGQVGSTADHDRPDYDTKGWTLLGEETVDGRRDRDVIKVGRDDGKFDKLMLVVLDGDLEMEGMVIRLARGAEITPQLKHYFKQGQRSRQIDLGKRSAVIKDIELTYGSVRGGGKARVQIWAR